MRFNYGLEMTVDVFGIYKVETLSYDRLVNLRNISSFIAIQFNFFRLPLSALFHTQPSKHGPFLPPSQASFFPFTLNFFLVFP